MAKSTKISAFDKTNLNAIRNDVNAALAQVAEKYGIKVELGNISFQNSTFTGKLNAAIATGNATETVRDIKSVDALKKMLKHCPGVAPLTKGVKWRGKVATLVGYESRRRKYPWLIEIDGVRKLYTDEAVAQMVGIGSVYSITVGAAK
jgi:hypothetical protein